jgi:hypothetical protein
VGTITLYTLGLACICSLSEIDILREYRRLDDTITMRLNRANATVRDRQREHESGAQGNVQNQACGYLWRELVGEGLILVNYPSTGLIIRTRKLETADAISRLLHDCC